MTRQARSGFVSRFHVVGLVGAALIPAAASAQVSGITFEEVGPKFSVWSDLTDLQKDREWEASYEGKCVEWTGEISDVGEDFRGYVVDFKHSSTSFPHLVTVDVKVPQSMEEEMLSMEKGQSYTYRATLDDYFSGLFFISISADWGCESS